MSKKKKRVKSFGFIFRVEEADEGSACELLLVFFTQRVKTRPRERSYLVLKILNYSVPWVRNVCDVLILHFDILINFTGVSLAHKKQQQLLALANVTVLVTGKHSGGKAPEHSLQKGKAPQGEIKLWTDTWKRKAKTRKAIIGKRASAVGEASTSRLDLLLRLLMKYFSSSAS